MIDDLFVNFNWIDILIVIIIFRIVYSGIKSNILVEFLALLGVVMANFVILHYYTRFSDFLHEKLFMPRGVQDFFAFLLIWLTVYVIFKLIINGWMLLIKAQTHPAVDQWGGASLSFVRSLFVCGLIFMVFLVSGNEYFQKISRQSFSGFYLLDFSPKVYRYCYDNVVVKFFPDEQLNEHAFQVLAQAQKQSHQKKK